MKLSDEPPDDSLAPTLGYDSKRMYLEFNGGCLNNTKLYTVMENCKHLHCL